MRSRLLLIWLVLMVSVGLSGSFLPSTVAEAAGEVHQPLLNQPGSTVVFLPMTANGYVPPALRLCRFGVGGSQAIDQYAVNTLGIGWYSDWRVTTEPVRPGGIGYMPTVRLSQTGLNSYEHTPDAAGILVAAQAQPGATWLIGNEPDRRYFQDDLEPHVYAQAYHDLYELIKSADPTARIAAGSIVQATPLRLQYLDMVLDSFQAQYGFAMPVDVWNIHAFILREERGSWGADIPPGIDVRQGMLYEIDDNADVEIFKANIRRFRQWMADRGYQDCPLIITEFGVQMPADYGFPPDRVNSFMNETFDYLSSATDPALGLPYDNGKLVQQWAWYSVADNNFNGWLFDASTRERTVFGDNFAAYTAAATPMVNLLPIEVEAHPVRDTSGDVISATLSASIANNGDMPLGNQVKVRFYLGDSTQDRVLIGENTAYRLDGCASFVRLDVAWDQASAGSHTFSIVVDPAGAIVEANEQDNTLVATFDF